MSKCNCTTNNDSKYFSTQSFGNFNINVTDSQSLLNPGVFAPIGEPRLLTMMAPVVFDESGLNLCRVVSIDHLVDICQNNTTGRTTDVLFDGLSRADLQNATTLQLQVVDIDFNFVCPSHYRYSEIKPGKNAPNISRVVLRDIDVTFAIKIIDANYKVCKEGMLTLRYLPSETCPGYDKDTNPSNVAFDLYTPYGISFAAENPVGCNKLVPTINYIGYIAGDMCQGVAMEEATTMYKDFEPNNGVAQGISAQALARVIAADDEYLAIGITLYFKVIYFVQYKFQHEGLCVPPKFALSALGGESSCLAFVQGDLLEQSILPLSVCVEPKTIK
ncbi:hypothetical protein AN640_04170 [Candidatus Epulonipiscium fishelsonii]|uniref:Uncharacterized protein n=2 Tax=Candidatus Epulonipiscium fishelsonii TaxID=77094 RepID=A0ACC8XHM8_9FIRM|nr:hypothetical protein AN640_06415 [Epulopiscium sp. SCG-D08WGA-EpuloA1]ONI45797.1 hypothetical protein AN640_04170 [Epulopiscium sp. SCG-D08WGA-EpuloA1]OON90897.1 MAG: hypothetical protein ATN32_02975 [Epulopiscium sp. AS2M-Bin002]